MKAKLTHEDVTLMVTLYLQGWRKIHLSRKFHIDHSTVFYHIKRHNAERGNDVVLIDPPPEEHIYAPTVNRKKEASVKMYADLLRESRERASLRKFKNPQPNIETLKILVQEMVE